MRVRVPITPVRAQGNGAGRSPVQPGEGSEEAIRDRDKRRQVVWEGGKRKDSPVPSCSLDLAVCLVLSPMQTLVLGVFYCSSRLLWVALSDGGQEEQDTMYALLLDRVYATWAQKPEVGLHRHMVNIYFLSWIGHIS